MGIFSFKNKKPKIIIVCGPTASGKTGLSIDLAKHYDGEIISADSRQVYIGLDIGSAKVTQKEMHGIPHHMIDVTTTDHKYSAAEYIRMAKIHIGEIVARGKTPIICGGTGQYIDALVFNKTYPNVPANPELRKELEKKTITELFEQLAKKDPRRALTVDRNNKVRLVRALEIIDTLGIVPVQKTNSPYSPLFIGLDLPKEQLNKGIKKRALDRFENQGMLQEAIDLHTKGLSYERMESLGLEYRYMARHLEDKINYDEMVRELTTKTIQYAKRQRTWFKRNKKIHWFNGINDTQEIKKLVSKFLKK